MILVVEDDPQVARLIALVLERYGQRCDIVADGRAALDRARTLRPAVIFADLTINGFGGQALCSALKSDPQTQSIPYVVLSGDADIAEKCKTMRRRRLYGQTF